MQSHRRALLASIGGVVTGGVAVATLTTEASANVTFGELNVTDRTYEQTSKLQDVEIQVNSEWQFSCDTVPVRWELILKVAKPNKTSEQIAETRMAPSSTSGSGTETISGSIFDTSQFTLSNFQLEEGDSQIEKQIDVTLVFNIVKDSKTIASSSITDTAILTITPGSIEGTTSLKGTGEIILSK